MLQFLQLPSGNVHAIFLRSIGVFLLWLMTSVASAQYGCIKGLITVSGGIPAKAVNVRLDDAPTLFITDTNGNYLIKNVVAGRHLLQVLNADTVALQQMINIGSNDTVIQHFELHDIPHQGLDEVMVMAAHSYVIRKTSESLRLNEDLSEVPQSIQITGQQSIRDQGLITTADILKTAAGAMSFSCAGQDGGVLLRGSISSNSVLRNGMARAIFIIRNWMQPLLKK